MSGFSDAASYAGASWFHIYLAEHLFSRYFPEGDEQEVSIQWLILHLSQQAAAGHLRTDLQGIADEMPEWYREPLVPGTVKENQYDPEKPKILARTIDSLIDRGLEKGLVSRLPDETGTADHQPVPRTPLLLSHDGRFLYLLKRRRAEDRFLAYLYDRSKSGVTDVFPRPSTLSETPDGELMKHLSEGQRFMILSGGPGTGKTTTVAKLLVLIRNGCLESNRPEPRVILAAPTGRAAARLGEALGENRTSSKKDLTGRTLHSLLGMSPDRPPKHNSDDPLPADLVIVDEASMVDLPMMNLLLDALAPSTTLLLVGDPDQLPSVEAGALLGDLLAGVTKAGNTSLLSRAITTLEIVYRSDTAILDAASAVRKGDMDALTAAFRHGRVALLRPTSPDGIATVLAEAYRNAYSNGKSVGKPDMKLFESFARLGVLTPLRRGPWGVSAMNDRISLLLGRSTSPFAGMPIMVTGNDRYRNLWNGDRGVLCRIDGHLRACFPVSDGIREFPLAALPGWEPAWVQTIHKSQGSEFESVTILLPTGAEKMLSREILYTALTRARSEVTLYADQSALESALSRKVVRNSRIRTWAATCPPEDESIS